MLPQNISFIKTAGIDYRNRFKDVVPQKHLSQIAGGVLELPENILSTTSSTVNLMQFNT